MNITITNQHCDNRGDESAIIGLIKILQQEFGKDISLLLLKQTRDSNLLSEDFRIQEKWMDNRYSTIVYLIIWCFFQSIGIDFRFFLPQRVKELIHSYESADLVLSSCGGPYIGDIYADHELFHLLHIYIPLLLKKKVCFSAPSMGPFKNKFLNPFRKKLLNKSTIIVRDQTSYEYVIRFLNRTDNIFLSSDACFGDEITEKKELSERLNIIGFTPLLYKYPNAENKDKAQDNYKESLIHFFNHLMDEDTSLQVEFFPQLYGKYSDISLINEFRNRFKYPDRTLIFSDKVSGREQQKEIGKMKMMVATRYHSAVFACKMFVPVICIAYEHKATAMMESFGLKDFTIDINDVSFENLIEKKRLLDSNYETVYKKQNDRLPKITAFAKNMGKIIHHVYNNTPNRKTEAIHFFDDIIAHPLLCKSCGMCEAVCPQHALKSAPNAFQQFTPVLNQSLCINCLKCVHVCKARILGENGISVIGPYRQILLAQSTNKNMVEKGSSGGVISELTRFGLNCGFFSKLLSVDTEKRSPIIAYPKFYDKNSESLPSNSKYISAPLCSIFPQKSTELGVTALPCETKPIKENSPETFVFGLFCSKLSTKGLIDYIMRRENLKDPINEIIYRKGQWPGKVLINTENKKFELSYARSAFSGIYNSFLYANSGCLLCDDYFNEQADISFGDPWGLLSNEIQNGKSVIIVRTSRGKDLVDQAVSAGVIKVEPFNLEGLIHGHLKEIYHKKTAIIPRAEFAKKYTQNLITVHFNNLISGKVEKNYNTFIMNNNWRIRYRNQYESTFSKPSWLIFLIRFTYTGILKIFLRKKSYLESYIKIAEKEQCKQ